MGFLTVCKICGKEFLATQSNRSYCSDECRAERWKSRGRKKVEHATAVCAVCGKEFVQRMSFQKYCSDSCNNKAYWSRNKEKIQERNRAKRATKICPACGKEFLPRSSRQVVCGDGKCAMISQRARGSHRTTLEQVEYEKQKKQEKQERELTPLSRVAREAKEAGLSYGHYTAIFITPVYEKKKAEREFTKAILNEDYEKAEKARIRAAELARDIEITRRSI